MIMRQIQAISETILSKPPVLYMFRRNVHNIGLDKILWLTYSIYQPVPGGGLCGPFWEQRE